MVHAVVRKLHPNGTVDIEYSVSGAVVKATGATQRAQYPTGHRHEPQSHRSSGLE